MLLHGPLSQVEPVIYDDITPELIRDLAIKSKGAAGPSQMDADDWRRILGSKLFGTDGSDLCKSIARLAKILCTSKLSNPSSISGLMACRLIPLDKNPGLRPIGVGEVLRRIIGKAVTFVLKSDLRDAAGGLQLCVGLEGGVEAGIHGMRAIFEEEETHGLIQVDANNAFNTINRKVLLHNIGILCPELSIYVQNCYARPARLFVTGGLEISSAEGTTQGDPVAMPWYAIGILPLLTTIRAIVESRSLTIKQAAFADDLTGAGTIYSLKIWWDAIIDVGRLLGYTAKPSKSWLIVKEPYLTLASSVFANAGIQITTEGRRHLGAVIGSESNKIEFVERKVSEWVGEMNVLSRIALTEPHAAYCAFTNGIRHEYTFVLRTIPDISDQLKPLDIAIDSFIESLFYGHEISESDRTLFALPVRLGGLGLIIPSKISETQYVNSVTVTKKLTEHVKEQREYLDIDWEENQVLKAKLKAEGKKAALDAANLYRSSLTDDIKIRCLESVQEKGASAWLTSLPLAKYGFHLEKQAFRDAIRLRYGIPLSNLPMTCVCGASFSESHALSCSRGGFVIIRHNEIRDITHDLLKEVCHDVEKEPLLTDLSGETFQHKTANSSSEARCDVSARGFWTRGNKAFLDIRVFNPLAKSHVKRSLDAVHKSHEAAKKREYNQRILQIEHGTFTPLVFSSLGGMSVECSRFYKQLNEKLAIKRDVALSTSMSFLRVTLSFSLLRSTLLCLRGSRSPKLNLGVAQAINEIDINVACAEARLSSERV